jgi:hypothetical protein
MPRLLAALRSLRFPVKKTPSKTQYLEFQSPKENLGPKTEDFSSIW